VTEEGSGSIRGDRDRTIETLERKKRKYKCKYERQER